MTESERASMEKATSELDEEILRGTSNVVRFIPRPRHDKQTDFPTYAFKGGTADYILGLDKKLKEKAVEIMNVALVEGPHENAIWGPNGFLPKEPA